MSGNLTYVTFTLSRWVLTGPSSTWRKQLDDYYKAEPVFALLGGITTGDWEPVHRFCEDNKIPDLMPIVDYPVISESDWYTLYPSRGIRQEGEAAARYLQGMAELFKDRSVVQVIRDSRRAQALAAGFRETWKGAGRTPVREMVLGNGEQLTPERLKQIMGQDRPAALLLWDDASSLAALKGLAGSADRPGIVLVSGTYLGKALWSVPEELRELLYMTYPYRLPQEDVRYDRSVKRVLSGKMIQSFDQQIIRQSYITNEILGKALLEMRGEYYRDFLLDTIGMIEDQYFPLYERVSFGPGQRYASKGCFIVRLGKGQNPKLERRSEWVTQ